MHNLDASDNANETGSIAGWNVETSRRRVLDWGLGGVSLLAAGTIGGLARAAIPTADMTIGPFYPMIRPLDQDGDLTVVGGQKVAAKGQVMHLSGRVLKPDGTPAAGARIELWQANAAGRYAHPADGSKMPLDDGFQGYGVQLADSEGRYRFKTVRPGSYRIPDGRIRTPHIHFDVQGKSSRIVTQMFLPGEELNASDFLFKLAEAPDTLMARKLPPIAGDTNALALNWDIVLVSD